MAAVLKRVPELMLCKPTNNDRWDRRAVELAEFLHRHGHCNVPEVRGEPDLLRKRVLVSLLVSNGQQ